MVVYKIFKYMDKVSSINKYDDVTFICSIPFDPANSDYAAFKRDINDESAQLEDAEGNLMTAEEAKAFVKELP